ncbi:hypothetical protein [Cognaticolwellia mytili]|uniref:hypothetical protein n=1 Tax=Cognaticolwellia mytili TaxID=1888913 RepID=UPI000A1766A9|nr:hypothetical protein [Cognaticolwellia mytili]
MHWQLLMKKGNRCFEEQQWIKAELYYKSAYSQLEGLWLQDGEYESLLMAWICACQNLAILFETQGEYDRSIGYLVKAYQEAFHTSQNHIASDSLRSLAFGALGATLKKILHFADKYPTCEDCLTKLYRLQQTIECQADVVH